MEKTALPKGKTYLILDAIKAGHTTISAIADQTGIGRRAVNAFVYALEKQGRVKAESYDVARCKQIFVVIKYEADQSKGVKRIHPTKQRSALTVFASLPTVPVHELQQCFFGMSRAAVASYGERHAYA